MLATSRTVKVKGRMVIEIGSINTSRGDNAKGAPLGARWAAISAGTIFTWVTKIEDQNTRPVIAANQIVEVTGNVKGVIPKRFSVIKVKNTLRNNPLLSLIVSLFIIWPNFLVGAAERGEDGKSSTRKGSNQVRPSPWSTLEKISANNSNASQD